MNGKMIIREYHGESYVNDHSYINGIDTFLKEYNLPEFTQEDPMNSPTSFKEVGYQTFSSQQERKSQTYNLHEYMCKNN